MSEILKAFNFSKNIVLQNEFIIYYKRNNTVDKVFNFLARYPFNFKVLKNKSNNI